MKILFVGGPTKSAIFGITPLARALASAGHQVFMASNDDMVPVIAAMGFPALSLTPHPQSAFIGVDGDDGPLPADAEGRMAFAGRMFGRLAAASLDGLRTLAKDWRPDLVVGGALAYAAPLFAAEHDIPFVRLNWYFGDSDGMDVGAVEVLGPQLGLLGVSGLPEPLLRVDVVPRSLRAPDTPRAEWMRWVPANLQQRLEPWMYTTGGRPRVCVTSGGRSTPGNLEFLRAVSASVRDLDAEVVITAPPDLAGRLGHGFGEIHVGWAPMDVVVPTCDLVVHPAGGVTSMIAMSAGVAQLNVPEDPIFAVPARRLSAFGAGITVAPEDNTPERIGEACRALLSDPSYRRSAARLAAEFAELPPPAAKVAVIEDLVTAARAF